MHIFVLHLANFLIELMKFILPLLFLPVFCFAQTQSDRAKITSKYDQHAIALAKDEAEKVAAQQKQLIADYRKRYSIVENERHSLQRIENGLRQFRQQLFA